MNLNTCKEHLVDLILLSAHTYSKAGKINQTHVEHHAQISETSIVLVYLATYWLLVDRRHLRKDVIMMKKNTKITKCPPAPLKSSPSQSAVHHHSTLIYVLQYECRIDDNDNVLPSTLGFK